MTKLEKIARELSDWKRHDMPSALGIVSRIKLILEGKPLPDYEAMAERVGRAKDE